MTNGWVDMKNTDMMLIMGGNPAENHPCGFKWPVEAKRTRNAKIISVDPRFTRTSAVADLFCQIRAGTDIAFLGGVVRYAIENNRIAKEYLVNYTNAAFIVKSDFKLPADTDGVFSGFDAKTQSYDKSTWNYAGTGGANDAAHHPDSQRTIPQSRRPLHFDSQRRRHEEGRDDYLCRRMDAAQLRHADNSNCSDPAALARQCGPRGRRRQRVARALQYSGRHGHGRDFRQSPRLFEGADSRR